MVSDTIRRGLGRFSGRSQGSPRRGLHGALVAPDRRGCNEKETTMRKSITAAAVAASLTVGGLTGAALGTPSLAGAADDPEIGRANVSTPVTNAHLLCSLLLLYKKI